MPQANFFLGALSLQTPHSLSPICLPPCKDPSVREGNLINHFICCTSIFSCNSALHIHINIDLFFPAEATHDTRVRTRTHRHKYTDAMESVNACRLKENISCLISKTQQSIFSPRKTCATTAIPSPCAASLQRQSASLPVFPKDKVLHLVRTADG